MLDSQVCMLQSGNFHVDGVMSHQVCIEFKFSK